MNPAKIQERRKQVPQVAVLLPREIARRVNNFLLDGKTGVVRINVKDGEVLNAHFEEFVAATM